MIKEIGIRFFEDRGVIKVQKWECDGEKVKGCIRPATEADKTWFNLCRTIRGARLYG